jgi:GTP-binding protein
MVDIPGLIEDAHKGKGLGHKFLRHIERTKLILLVIDMAGADGRDPCGSYKALTDELRLYSGKLGKKERLIAANKMDLAGADINYAKFKKKIKEKVYAVSALKGDGIKELAKGVSRKLKRIRAGHEQE